MRIWKSDRIQDKLKNRIAKLKYELARLKSDAGSDTGILSNLKEHIEELGDAVCEHGKQARHQLADQAHMVRKKAGENPAATCVIAAGIGFLAGLLLRRF